MSVTTKARWGRYQPLFDKAVAFAVYSLTSRDDDYPGLLHIRGTMTVAEAVGRMGAAVLDSLKKEETGDPDLDHLDPTEVLICLQVILNKARFPKDDQPVLYYEGMPDPPSDPDLRVFQTRPAERRRPQRDDNDAEIAYVVGQVVGLFGLNQYVSDVAKLGNNIRPPSAIDVVAAALSQITDGRVGSTSSIRRSLTAVTREAFEMGRRDGEEQRAAETA